MAKHKTSGKGKGKGSQFVIRIDKDERTAFVSICEQLDTSAAREIRRFMREFVATHTAEPAAAAEVAAPVAAAPVEPTAPEVVAPEVLPQPASPPAAPADTSAVAEPEKPKKTRRRVQA